MGLFYEAFIAVRDMSIPGNEERSVATGKWMLVAVETDASRTGM